MHALCRRCKFQPRYRLTNPLYPGRSCTLEGHGSLAAHLYTSFQIPFSSGASVMSLWLALVAVSIFLPLQSWCQTVQDEWTAPAAPDGSTPLKSGTKFTLLWKSGLQNNFKTYCPSCDTEKLDLWVTNFNGTEYMSKIGRAYNPRAFFRYDVD